MVFIWSFGLTLRLSEKPMSSWFNRGNVGALWATNRECQPYRSAGFRGKVLGENQERSSDSSARPCGEAKHASPPQRDSSSHPDAHGGSQSVHQWDSIGFRSNSLRTSPNTTPKHFQTYHTNQNHSVSSDLLDVFHLPNSDYAGASSIKCCCVIIFS